MILAKVIRRVVASAKSDRLPARQMLEIQPLPEFGDPSQPMIALDSVSAGPGDLVLVMQEGTGARETLLPDPKIPLPAQVAIVGIVDRVDRV